MKTKFTFFISLLLAFYSLSAHRPFITRLNLATAGSAATELSLGEFRTGSVNYSRQELGGGDASGSGKNWTSFSNLIGFKTTASTLADENLESRSYTSKSVCSPDYETLKDFYRSTNGGSWTNQWDTTDCTVTNWYGVTKDENDRVIGLSLTNNRLGGNIPSTVGNLTNLSYLNLSANQISGPIPLTLGNLTNLEGLNLASNYFGDSIPSTIGNLTKLNLLYLYNNSQLSGSIPPTLGNLTSLQYFELYNTQVSGNIPSTLGNLTNLLRLFLFNNQLTGNIPSTLGNLTNLQLLYLYSNQLDGTIPSSLGNLTNLYHLYLNNNQLSGCFPSSLHQLCMGHLVAYSFSDNAGLPGGGDFTAFCNSNFGECLSYYLDSDEDGYGNPLIKKDTSSQPVGYVSNNQDCDDTNASIHPGADDTNCNGIDEDCDGTADDGYVPADCKTCSNGAEVTTLLTWYLDADNDGHAISYTKSCTSPGTGYSTTVKPIDDCNDSDASIKPGATEICDGIDNDCDGQTDEGVTTTYYADADGDGFGNPAVSQKTCSQPSGYVTNNTDCNDIDANIKPGVTEICDGIDNDCDGQIDEGVIMTYYADADGDGFGNPTVSVQAACIPPKGYVTNNSDCNDKNMKIKPGATEICDGIDNDCDGLIDEGVTSTYYADADGDGFGNATVSIQACNQRKGYVTNNTDCNDNDAAINPTAIEKCDGIDNDCDGQIDEGVCTQCQNAITLTTTKITSTSAQLNWTASVSPVEWQIQYSSTTKGSKAIIIPLPGISRSYNLTGLLSNQNYTWQIRAKCGKNWTTYSTAIGFKTTAFTLADENLESRSYPEEDVFRIYPNPSNGRFTLDLQLPGISTTSATIIIRDITGKSIHTQKTSLQQGNVKKIIEMPAGVSSGIYLISISANKEIYQTKLNYIR